MSVDTLGLVLMHSIWQAALAAGALKALFSLRREMTAGARATAATVALGVTLATVLITCAVLLPQVPEAVLLRSVIPVTDSTPEPGPLAPAGLPVSWAVAAWACWVAFRSASVAGAWATQRRWSLQPAAPKVSDQLSALLARLDMPRVEVFTCVRATVPQILGTLRPAIVLPLSTLNGLTTEAMEAILAHELAHIARLDHWGQLLASAMDILFGWHPSVRWMVAVLRREREFACDELAAGWVGGAMPVAKALLAAEELRQGVPAVALGALNGPLSQRIARLLGETPRPGRIAEDQSGRTSILLLLLMGIVAMAAWAAQSKPSPAPPAEPAVAQSSASPTPVPAAAPAPAKAPATAATPSGGQGVPPPPPPPPAKASPGVPPPPPPPPAKASPRVPPPPPPPPARRVIDGGPGPEQEAAIQMLVDQARQLEKQARGAEEQMEREDAAMQREMEVRQQQLLRKHQGVEELQQQRAVEQMRIDSKRQLLEQARLSVEAAQKMAREAQQAGQKKQSEADRERKAREEQAQKRFGSLESRRAKLYVKYGPPDEIEAHKDRGYEMWMYHQIPGVGDDVIFKLPLP